MATPFDLEQQRQEELAQAEKQSTQASQKTVEANLIQDATPDDQKPKGASKLPLLIFGLGTQIPQIIQPSLQGLIQKYIPNPDVCIPTELIDELIIQRNNIVQSLNNIGVKVDKLGSSITGVSNFLNITLGIITSVEIVTLAASLAAKAVPVIPGAVPAALNDAQTFIRKVTFDKLGNSKLSKLQSIINSSALVISIIGTYVLNVVEILNQIDNYIKRCKPELGNELLSISTQIKTISESQKQAQETQNQVTYNGFIIEIEEVPYTPTVTRRRALGKNSQNITLIQTELSFTTDNQVLINELKLIIDKNNLKAY